MTSCTRQTGYALKGAAEMRNDVNRRIGHGSRAGRNLARMRRAGLLGLLAIWILSAPALAAATEQVYYFHNDHLGTPQAMSDAAGRKVWEAEYEPFGKAAVNEDPDGDGQVVVNNLRFPGQYYDAETSLHYNYHRDYDPATGRYLQPDPIGVYGLALLSLSAKDPIDVAGGDTNLYAHVSNNPINLTDPWGLLPDIPMHDPGNSAGGPNWIASPSGWTGWVIFRTFWNWRTPPGTPYPPGFGGEGPGSTDPIGGACPNL